MEITRYGLLLAKIESSYGVDSSPTLSQNIIAVARGQVTLDIAAEPIDREILDRGFGRVNGVNALQTIGIKFRTEIRGNRTDGTAPDISAGNGTARIEIDPLLMACNLEPTFTAETSPGARDGKVEYKPIFPGNGLGTSCTIYFYTQRKLYKVTGCKGDIENLVLEAGKFGYIDWNFQGLYAPPVDANPPAVSPVWLATKPPLCQGAGSVQLGANTSLVVGRVQIKLGNVITRREDMNSAGGVRGFTVTDRNTTGTFDPESESEATEPFWANWAASTVKTLTAKTSQTDSGNRFSVSGSIKHTKINYSDSNGKRIQNVDFAFRNADPGEVPGSELTLTWS